ncbi:MAG: Hsp20/alpha crystallin family protein, partial [Lacipirellulaceae bacterium]
MSNAVSKNRVREFLPNNWSDVDTLLGHFFGPTYAGVKSVSTGRSPLAPASFWEGEDAYHVEVDLPGVAREDVEITFDKGELKIA